MKKLAVAVIAAILIMPGFAYATSIQEARTTQIMQCVDKKSGSELEDCVSDVVGWTINNGAHEATKEITAHVEDVTGIKTINGGYQVHAAIAQIDQALSKKGGSTSQEELDRVKEDLKKWQGWLSYWQPHAQSLEKHLRRAEDRIRELEDKLDYYRSGGAWNPTNW